MQMPTVSNQMKQLTALFSGTWKGEERLHPSDWDPAGGSASAIWVVRPAVDGFALLVDYDEARDGQVVYRGHGVHGWDAGQGCFFAYWFDNIGMMPAAGNRATLDGNRYTYQEAGPMGHSRFTYEWMGDVFTFRIDRSRDGSSWSPMHEGRYQRQPGTSF